MNKMLIDYETKRKDDDVKYLKESFKMIKLMISCRFFPLNMNSFFYLKGGSVRRILLC